MSKLIADSGSTKTDWTLLQGNRVVKQIKTIETDSESLAVDTPEDLARILKLERRLLQ